MNKGQFIVFEGGEGAGKTTQLQWVQDWLSQTLGETATIVTTREPGGTLLGQEIRGWLLNQEGAEPIQEMTELLLYMADRSHHVQNVLKPELEQGKIVLCDRYCDSTLAYQGYGRGFDLDLIQELNDIATGGLTADMTLWLDVEVERGLTRVQKRGKCDRFEQADLDFHHRIRQGFMDLAQAEPQRIIRIDSNVSEEGVFQQIQSALKQRFSFLG